MYTVRGPASLQPSVVVAAAAAAVHGQYRPRWRQHREYRLHPSSSNDKPTRDRDDDSDNDIDKT